MGEGLSDEELNYFFDLASDPGSPDLIDIRKMTEILLPKMEAKNLLAARNTTSVEELPEGSSAAAQVESNQE